MKSDIKIVPMTSAHAEQVLEIYRQGIVSKHATYETELPPWNEWDVRHTPEHRYVAIDDNTGLVVGWVASTPYSYRACYRGILLVSLYVREDSRGRGIGSSLLEHYIKGTEEAGVWTIRAKIFPENEASVHLHKKFGFREVGYLEKTGKMDGKWRNEVYLERRSKVVD